MPLGREVDLGPGDIVLDGDPAPALKKGAQPPPNFRLMSVVTKRLGGSKCHLVRRYIGLGPGHIVLDGGLGPHLTQCGLAMSPTPPGKGHSSFTLAKRSSL